MNQKDIFAIYVVKVTIGYIAFKFTGANFMKKKPSNVPYVPKDF